MADAAGAEVQALASYSAALTADPASLAVAIRAYRQAIDAGDKMLALRAARALELQDALPVDGRLLLLSESFAKADWREAQRQIDAIEASGTFAFLVPVARGWMMLGARQGDPLGALDAKNVGGLAATYVQEHRGLLLLALKQADEGATAVKIAQSNGIGEMRNLQLRFAAAQRLVELGKRPAALDLLGTEGGLYALARDEVNAGRPLLGSVVRPETGLSMLFARVANDLIRDNASPVAVTLGRLATFADAGFRPAQLTLARALAANQNPDGALAALDRLGTGALGAAMSDTLRFDILINAERFEPVLQLATARAALPTAGMLDHARLGEVLARMERHTEAAAAYTRAIEAMPEADRTKPGSWNLWLLMGREYDLAGNWAKARPALEQAVALAPDEPTALNHLGYSALVNGGSVPEAMRLIERASALRPNDAAITDSLGWALFRSGQVDRAIQLLEQASQAEPTIAEIGEHLGDAYWAAGRRVDARYAWRAALVQAEGVDGARIAAKIEFGPGAKP